MLFLLLLLSVTAKGRAGVGSQAGNRQSSAFCPFVSLMNKKNTGGLRQEKESGGGCCLPLPGHWWPETASGLGGSCSGSPSWGGGLCQHRAGGTWGSHVDGSEL